MTHLRPPLISIIVPVKNMSGKLENLKSWLADADSIDLEVIIVHDVDDSDTGIELRILVESNPQARILLLEGAYGSPGFTRNAGLEVATGSWICFWDSDDIGHPRTLSKNLARAERKIQVFQFRKIDFGSHKLLSDARTHVDILDLVKDLGIWRMAFPHEHIGDIKFNSYKMGEDQIFFSEVFGKKCDLTFIDEIVYDYSVGNQGQLTQNLNAILDLHKTVEYFRNLLNSQQNVCFLIKALYFRLWISSINRLPFKLAIMGTWDLLKYFIVHSNEDKMIILKTMRRLAV